MLGIDVKVNVRDYGAITREAVYALSKEIRTQARQDILGSGFPRSWAMGTTTRVRKAGDGYILDVNQRPSFARVFEYGGTSEGEPLLWMGITSDTKNVSASNYPGKLVRPGLSRAGFKLGPIRLGRSSSRPRKVLIDARTRKVKYVGIERVTIRPVWSIRDIAVAACNKFLELMQEQK
jgi:hypothetical protein